MTNTNEVKAGTCSDCGRELIQIKGVRTYHPIGTLGPTDECSALLYLGYTGHKQFLSLTVKPESFIPNKE